MIKKSVITQTTMRIKKLSFENRNTGWSIDEIAFNRLTLLVGASGVGKTQILRIIMGLQRIANGSSVNGWAWNIEFEERGSIYRWIGEFSCSLDEVDDDNADLSPKNNIVLEQVYVDGKIIIDRNTKDIIFNGNKTPKLDLSRSILSLLKEEEQIKPIFQAWNHLSIMTIDDSSTRRVSVSAFLDIVRSNVKDLKNIKNIQIPPIEKLYLLYKNKIAEFDTIVNSFKDIFPLVETIDFEIKHINKNDVPLIRLKERNVSKWISQGDISSGMFRTLLQIIMVVLAEDGDVILIDEFENSLGINCIDSVADLVINPDADIQFIITSHHPYIINNIDYKNWKIVTRDGSKVSVHTTDELNIGNHSKHDAFIQLIQTDAYKKGIL